MLLLSSVLWYCFLSTLSEAKKDDGGATLIFGGDVCLGDPVEYFAGTTCDYKRPFSRIKPYLKEADYVIANLESVLWKDRTPPKDDFLPKKLLKHWSRAKSVEGLSYAGVNLVSLGNNHAADFGEKGINSTIETLKKAGIERVGLTDEGKETQKPVIKTINGVKIGFLSYCYVGEGCLLGKDLMPIEPAWFNKTIAKKEIQDLRKKVDYLVVMMHWGLQHLPVPTKHVRYISKELNMFGVNLTIGSHPHVPQSYQCIGKDYFVAYSLGNLLFLRTGVINPENSEDKFNVSEYEKQMKEVHNPTQQSFLLKMKVSREKLLEASYLQFVIKDEPITHCLQPTPITGKWGKVCETGDLSCLDLTAITIGNEDASNEYGIKMARECVP